MGDALQLICIHCLLAVSLSKSPSALQELLAVLPQLLVNFYDLLHAAAAAVSCPVMVSVFLTQGATD